MTKVSQEFLVQRTLKVLTKQNVMLSHSEHLIIPLDFFAKSLRSFIEKNPRNKKYIDNELNGLAKIFSYTYDVFNNLDVMCNKPKLKLDGVAYEMGLVYSSLLTILQILLLMHVGKFLN